MGALFVAVGAATFVIARRDPGLALAGNSLPALWAELAAGALLVAAALAATGRWRSARVAPLLAAAGLAWPLAEWNSPVAGSAFTVGLVLYAAWPPLLATAALRGTSGCPLALSAKALLAVAFATSILLLGVVSAAIFDPPGEGCSGCPANHLLVAGDARAWHDLGQIGLALSAAWAAALVGLIALSLARSSATRRRVAAPIAVPAVAAVALFGVDALHGAGRGFLSNDPTDRLLRLAQAALLAAVFAAAAWGWVRARRRRAELARLVIELGSSPSPGALREHLAAILGDPSIELFYRPDHSPGWIDAGGHVVTPPADGGRETTAIVAGGRELAIMVHRRGLLDDPALAHEIAVTAQLALEHERLHASRRAQLERLRASRARIVATADAERGRLERDLHDGAQQRLVTLALGIRLLRRQLVGDPALDTRLGLVEDELRAAVADLRRLAVGLFPGVLREDGLGAALDALSEEVPRLVLGELPDRRFAPAVESAGYFVVLEALRLASTGNVRAGAHVSDSRLVVDVRSVARLVGPAIRIEDRVGAVGGALVAGGHSLRAELPCES
jgi:signal transduction histidine kinase